MTEKNFLNALINIYSIKTKEMPINTCPGHESDFINQKQQYHTSLFSLTDYKMNKKKRFKKERKNNFFNHFFSLVCLGKKIKSIIFIFYHFYIFFIK